MAMTITLAAVYAPIGFVSGVTGALFREFAFTLAGSVVVSGFIALTLSPMMCSKLLRHDAGQGGFGRFVDRTFDRLRRAYRRRLASSLNFRALTLLILVGVLALTGVMYASTPRELAPEEDQGVLLSLIKTPQIGNLDYIEQATQKLYSEARTVPEVSHAFIINGVPTVRTGFAGAAVEALGPARAQSEAGAGGAGAEIPRRADGAGAGLLAAGAAGLDRRRADAIRHPHHRRLHDARRRRAEDAAGGQRERAVPVHRRRSQVRHAAIRVQGRRRQGQPHRRQHAGRRNGAVDDARRQLRQPVQPLRPQLSGHPAGAARISPDAGMADALPIARRQRRTRAAVGGGERLRAGAAERADELPAAQFRDTVGRAVPRPHARRGARFPQGEVAGDFPRRLQLRFSGRLRASTSRKATPSFTSSSSR